MALNVCITFHLTSTDPQQDSRTKVFICLVCITTGQKICRYSTHKTTGKEACYMRLHTMQLTNVATRHNTEIRYLLPNRRANSYTFPQFFGSMLSFQRYCDDLFHILCIVCLVKLETVKLFDAFPLCHKILRMMFSWVRRNLLTWNWLVISAAYTKKQSSK